MNRTSEARAPRRPLELGLLGLAFNTAPSTRQTLAFFLWGRKFLRPKCFLICKVDQRINGFITRQKKTELVSAQPFTPRHIKNKVFSERCSGLRFGHLAIDFGSADCRGNPKFDLYDLQNKPMFMFSFAALLPAPLRGLKIEELYEAYCRQRRLRDGDRKSVV